MKEPSLLIEFVGLPGAGKTEIAMQTAARLREQAQFRLHFPVLATGRAPSLRHKLVPSSCVLLKRPSQAFRGLHVVGMSRQPTVRRVASIGLNWLWALSNSLHFGESRLAILDQGMWQVTWSLFLTSGRSSVREAAFEALDRFESAVAPTKHLVFKLEVPRDVARDRFEARNEQSAIVGSRPELWDRSVPTLEAVSDLLTDLSARHPHVSIHTTGGVASGSDEVLETILRASRG